MRYWDTYIHTDSAGSRRELVATNRPFDRQRPDMGTGQASDSSNTSHSAMLSWGTASSQWAICRLLEGRYTDQSAP